MENIVFIIALVLSMLMPVFVPKMFVKLHSRKFSIPSEKENGSSCCDEPLLNR